MQAEKQKIISPDPYTKFKHVHNRLPRVLIGILIILVFLFDFLSVYASKFIGRPYVDGSVVSIGIILAFVIVMAIVAVALYYIYRVNSAWLDLRKSPDE